ncbi:MAG: transporter [Myxococcales bacterium]|nr:transporter [Myxococcales bacterium]
MLLCVERTARACAACGCGDPTLTVMGSEKPFAGRFRTALSGSWRRDTMGYAGEDEVVLTERRLDLRLAWAPAPAVFIELGLPLLDRQTRDVTLAEARTTGLGDAELRAKLFVYQDDVRPSHLIAVTPGVQFPTGKLQRDANGDLLPMEAQPTAGVFSALLGASYAYFAAPWSFYSSLNASHPLGEVEGFRLSSSLRGTLALQLQALDWLALRAGPDFRVDSKARDSGESDPHSGGFIAFATADVVVSPFEDWLLGGGVNLPVWNALQGRHEESPIWRASVTTDW